MVRRGTHYSKQTQNMINANQKTLLAVLLAMRNFIYLLVGGSVSGSPSLSGGFLQEGLLCMEKAVCSTYTQDGATVLEGNASCIQTVTS
jgi:hypothetical protein